MNTKIKEPKNYEFKCNKCGYKSCCSGKVFVCPNCAELNSLEFKEIPLKKIES